MMFLHVLTVMVTHHVKESDGIVLVSSYGVFPSASYNFILTGNNFLGTILMIAPEEKLSRVLSSKFAKICKSPQLISQKFHTANSMKNYYTWNGTLTARGTYFSYVLNCKNRTFDVTYRIFNSNSYLDYRENFIPYFYVILAFLYPTFTVLWIINSLMHPKFFVFIHSLLTLSTMIKAISLFFTTNYWVSKIVVESPSNYLRTFSEVGSVFANSFLFSINGLAALGLNSFRQDMSLVEIIRLIFVVICFFILRLILDHSNSIFYDFPFIVLMVLLAIFYIKISSNGVLTAFRLLPRFGNNTPNNQTMLSKMVLVIRFGIYLSAWMAITYMFGIYIYIVSTVKAYKISVEEFFYVTVSVLDMKFFMLKNEYEPLNNDENSNDDRLREKDIRVLKDPKTSEYVVINEA